MWQRPWVILTRQWRHRWGGVSSRWGGVIPGHNFCNPSPGENLTARTSHSTECRYKNIVVGVHAGRWRGMMLHPLSSEGRRRQFSFQNTNEVPIFTSSPVVTFLHLCWDRFGLLLGRGQHVSACLCIKKAAWTLHEESKGIQSTHFSLFWTWAVHVDKKMRKVEV